MTTNTRPLINVPYAAITLSILVLLVAALTPAHAGERLSRSSESQGGAGSDKTTIVDELDALVVEGSRDKSTRGASQAPGSQQAAMESTNFDFWIYDADVELYSDWDNDGYYVGIDLQFDADTVYSAAEVYAVVYLSYEFGPWNEYTATDNFIIYGASGSDAYRIETELLSGYATGDYDLLIELFDAYDGSFVASFGPEDSAALSYLPLEDADLDTPERTTLIIDQGGGGAIGLAGLMALLGLLVLRLQRSAAV